MWGFSCFWVMFGSAGFLWPLVFLIWSRHERSSRPACQCKSAPSPPLPPIRLQENARLSFQPECRGCARCNHQCQRSTVPKPARVKTLTSRRDRKWEVESNSGLTSHSEKYKSRWMKHPPKLSVKIVLSMPLNCFEFYWVHNRTSCHSTTWAT